MPNPLVFKRNRVTLRVTLGRIEGDRSEPLIILGCGLERAAAGGAFRLWLLRTVRRGPTKRLMRVSQAGISLSGIDPLAELTRQSNAPISSNPLKPERRRPLQAERAADVLIHLRDFVRPGPSRQRFVAIMPLIDATVGLAMIEATQTNVEITVHAGPDLPLVFADNIQIQQVLLNLLRNAIDAMVTAEVEERRIVVQARRKGAGKVEVSVADTGPGISDGLREKILEPFVTTKPRGMGMGLSISRSIVEAHGGSLRTLHSDSSGAIFVFDLPIYDSEGNTDAG